VNSNAAATFCNRGGEAEFDIKIHFFLGINYVYRSSSFLITQESPAFLERAKPPPVSPPVLL
jgi:hypothetical protein